MSAPIRLTSLLCVLRAYARPASARPIRGLAFMRRQVCWPRMRGTCVSPISSISASPRQGQPPRPGSSSRFAPKEDQALARFQQAAAEALDKCDHPRAGTSTSASPRLQQSRRPPGCDRRRSSSCALTTTGGCSHTTARSRGRGLPSGRYVGESPTVVGAPISLEASLLHARMSRGMSGWPMTLRLSGTSAGCRLRSLSSRGVSAVDRVLERRKAAALARHYRDEEGL